jgi:hypothetical protein
VAVTVYWKLPGVVVFSVPLPVQVLGEEAGLPAVPLLSVQEVMVGDPTPPEQVKLVGTL